MDPKNKNIFIPGGVNPHGKHWPEASIEQNAVFTIRGAEFVPVTWEDFENAPSPRVIKSHAPVTHIAGAHGQGPSSLGKDHFNKFAMFN